MGKRRKKLKAPNGKGTINFLNGKRKKPYQVIVTIGFDKYGKQLRKSLGTFKTYEEAYDFLMNYNKDPYDIDYSKLTIDDVFNRLEPLLWQKYKEGKMSKSNYANLTSVYKNQLYSIRKTKIMDIKKRDLQNLIRYNQSGHTTQGYMKTMLVKLFKYAIDELDLPITQNPAIGLEITPKLKSDMHKPFTTDEINELWNHKDDFIVKIILIYIYTGLRPTELIDIKTDNVFIDENYMIGGNKTDNGRNRIIPIHPKIKSIIEEFYNQHNVYLISKSDNTSLSYDYYRKRFKKCINMLQLEHKPDDTRHTFATYTKLCGVSDTDRKILLGHSLADDVTNNVYTHLNIDYLLNEIKKLNYEE